MAIVAFLANGDQKWGEGRLWVSLIDRNLVKTLSTYVMELRM